MAAGAAFFQKAEGGVRVMVRLTPKASRDRVDGLVAEADGQPVLKAAVTAVPEDGKANQALIKMLAKAWKLPRTSIDIVHGATDRRKTLFLSGEPQALAAVLEQWMARLP